MVTIRPARGADRDLQLDVDACRQIPDTVGLAVRIRDRDAQRRRLEIVLSIYEARRLAHALLDHCNPSRSTSADD